jgi:hypothetical protein
MGLQGDRFVASGVFALVRHRVYAAWTTQVFPGLALLIQSGPMSIPRFWQKDR